jgi:hypothetical protein
LGLSLIVRPESRKKKIILYSKLFNLMTSNESMCIPHLTWDIKQLLNVQKSMSRKTRIMWDL